MVYKDYEFYLWKYHQTQMIYNDILSEKEELFQKTQIHAITYDKEKVNGGVGNDALEEYMMKVEEKKIDARLFEVRKILDERKRLLDEIETDLRASTHLYDKVYRMRYLDNLSPYVIGKKLNYSKAQIYRILQKMKR